MQCQAARLLYGLALLLTAAAHAQPGPGSCEERWFVQQTDHYSWTPPPGAATFSQRWFICTGDWRAAGSPPNPNIFYYFGNEDDVELYVNNTGLMWETAPAHAAVLIFAEHRFYGKTKPFPPGTQGCMKYLTTEQALADSAALLRVLRAGGLPWDTPAGSVVGFGGSYGGMLAAWFRLKYPFLVDGVIAASAPIWAFEGLTPPYNSGAFMAQVSKDASPEAGAPPGCREAFLKGQKRVALLSKTSKGRATLSEAFRTCVPLGSEEEAMGLIPWLQDPWSYMAMGNFPYPSGYVIHGDGQLPAWPVRVACARLVAPLMSDLDGVPPATAILDGVREAVGVIYNHSGAVPCFYNGGGKPLRVKQHSDSPEAGSSHRGFPEAGPSQHATREAVLRRRMLPPSSIRARG
eukprot:CAMPEP_0180119414 /NCGR_PEP_ID=MMETSP0986-20121125/1975_1 /TAXON_ID=697907 /ORGANISM="non described non described, Strain CCMP2293" /LENGTH=404 /DNA_ID=CAMNT_0022058425 /DNA_START=12 /DNA_END=1223 /DNA_ORIENTATION=-